ncbi:LysR substrate-binding domain-containing protein [Nocardia sp. R16R-3T]
MAHHAAARSAFAAAAESPRKFRGLESHIVGRDQLVVVVAPQHRWARNGSVDPGELAATAVIQRETGSGTRTWFENAVARAIPGWAPTVALELSSTTAIKTGVASGVGPAVVSSLAVAAEIAAGALASPSVNGLDLARTLRAVWPAGHRLTGPARDLYAIARRTC